MPSTWIAANPRISILEINVDQLRESVYQTSSAAQFQFLLSAFGNRYSAAGGPTWQSFPPLSLAYRRPRDLCVRRVPGLAILNIQMAVDSISSEPVECPGKSSTLTTAILQICRLPTQTTLSIETSF